MGEVRERDYGGAKVTFHVILHELAGVVRLRCFRNSSPWRAQPIINDNWNKLLDQSNRSCCVGFEFVFES